MVLFVFFLPSNIKSYNPSSFYVLANNTCLSWTLNIFNSNWLTYQSYIHMWLWALFKKNRPKFSSVESFHNVEINWIQFNNLITHNSCCHIYAHKSVKTILLIFIYVMCVFSQKGYPLHHYNIHGSFSINVFVIMGIAK